MADRMQKQDHRSKKLTLPERVDTRTSETRTQRSDAHDSCRNSHCHAVAGSAAGADCTFTRFRVLQNEGATCLYDQARGQCPLCVLSHSRDADAAAAFLARKRNLERGGFAQELRYHS